jgi:hypothetical protein
VGPLFSRQAGGSAAGSLEDDGAEVIGDIFAEPEGEAPEPPPGEPEPPAPPPVPAVAVGGAASSGDLLGGPVVEPLPPLHPPAGPAPRAPSARAASMADSVRGSAEVVVQFPSGKISFYASDGRFEAVCSRHKFAGYSQCRLTRTATGSDRKKSQGRPFGLLAAWLLNAEAMETKDDHCNRLWLLSSLSKADRLSARRYLAAQPAGTNLLDCERAKAQNEDSEPDGVP